MDPAALRAAPGRYTTVFQGNPIEHTVTAEGGSLWLKTPNWPAARQLHPASAARMHFFIRESEREYTFERDASGRVARIRVTGGGGPEIIAPRVD
jgi:hypothetical protein